MKENKKNNRYLFSIAIILGAIIAIACWTFSFAVKSYQGEAKWVYIPQNTDNEAIRDSLESKLGTVGKHVYLIWKVMDGNIANAHGAYLIKKNDIAFSISQRIMRGQQTPIKLTINNIRTIKQLSERISTRMSWDNNSFIDACNKILPDAGFKVPEYPAAFLPDTYEFYWTSSPETVVKRLLDYRNKFWDDQRREKATKIGLSPVKIATLASIVEEETNRSDERPIVARLYLNRLKKGMLLQADPTVKFAIGDFSIRRITKKHLAIQSPYNTYKNVGLPPGPIRIVEKSTIDKILDAPQHNYLYMCAKEDFSGRHNFAVDYNTHQRNAARYQAELNRRNIK